MTALEDQKNNVFCLRSFALSAIIAMCILLGLASVYVKYSLDFIETSVSAPDAAYAPARDLHEKTLISLGYGGFLGAAQDYIAHHDRTALSDMRMQYKTAQENLIRIGDKASTSVRRDIRGILDLFANVIAKAEEGNDALSQGLTSADLLAASTALNVLDTRLSSAQAVGRVEAQNAMKKWSLALLMIALSGLVAAGSIAAWVLWSSDAKKNEAIATLTQSVSNLVHGDNQKAIWGIERGDKIGELARTIDLARMYFTQIPDISIAGEDGPIRLKFDGESKTLFQAMMKKITETFERAQHSSLGFTGTMNAQQDVFKSLSEQMKMSLSTIEEHGRTSEETVRDLSSSLSSAALSLVQMQEESTSRFSGLIPHMKERIQNMAEVTVLAGNQVSQSLQSLLKSESTLRQSATQSQAAVKQLASATNQMGERMFAALNLMQATSKALGETIFSSQTKFNEAVDTLAKGEGNMTKILSRAEQRLTNTVKAEENMAALVSRTAGSAEKLEQLVSAISDRHSSVDDQIMTAAHRMDSIVANFDQAQRSMNDAAGQIRRDGALVSNLLSELRTNNDQLLSSISQNSQSNFNAAQSLAEKSHALMQRLEVQIQQQAQMAESRIDELTSHGQSMAQQATTTTSSLAQAILSIKGEQEKLATARARFTDTVNDLGSKLESHATSTFGKTEQWAAQSFTKISSLTEQMESFMSRLSMLGQLTGTLGTVAGQLGQLVPTLTQFSAGMPMMTEGQAPIVQINMDETKALIVKQTEDVILELQSQWHSAVVQIEAMHDQLAQIVVQQKDQLETRLVILDKKLRDAPVETYVPDFEAEEKQAQIMNEVISAISKINEHVRELDEVIEDAGLRKESKEA